MIYFRYKPKGRVYFSWISFSWWFWQIPRGKKSYNFINDYIASSAEYTEFWAWLPTTNDEIKIYWKQSPGCMCDSFKCVYCKCRRQVMFILNYPLLNPLSSISQEMYHCCVKISQGKIESWEIFKIVLVKTRDLNEGCLWHWIVYGELWRKYNGIWSAKY